MRKIFAWIFVLMFLTLVIAEDPFDYNSGDYTTLDWETVDWTQIPVDKISEVPLDRLDYTKLSVDQRLGMSAEQIAANFDNIGDLSKDVYVKEAQKAFFQKFKIPLRIEGSAKLTNGVLSTDTHSIDVEKGYGNGILSVTPDGEIEYIVFGGEEIEIPATDTVQTGSMTEFSVKIGDKTVTVDGTLTFEKGKMYVRSKDSATVDGVKIEPNQWRRKEKRYFFFDGQEHDEATYVSMDTESKRIILRSQTTKSRDITVSFKPGNVFLPVEKGDDVVFTTKHKIIIQNREDQGLIPEVRVVGSGSKDVVWDTSITNGVFRYFFDSTDSEVEVHDYMAWSYEKGGSTPMSLLHVNEEGESLYGTPEEPKKILINNFNEMGFAPFDSDRNLLPLTFDTAPAIITESLHVSAVTVPTLKDQYPNLKVLDGVDLEDLRLIENSMRALPPAARDSVRGFIVFDNEEWKQHNKERFGDDFNAYTSSDGIIRISKENLRNFKTIYHEAAHDLHFQIRRQEAAQASKQSWLSRAYDYVASEDTSFDAQWTAVAGDVYGKGLGDRNPNTNLAVTWEDGKADPRNGIARAYGANDIMEDVATMVENVYRNPDAYIPLITIDNPQYDPRYKQKLDLLLRYKFISQDRYDFILRGGKWKKY